ncbi:MAG: NAD(P)H-hydrate epimerase, partial [Lachnospiraceae bacterium]
MKYVLNQKQMQMVDAYSINEVGIPSMVLMERAALGVCEVIKKKYGALCRVLSVCGVGNNGADAIACARILAQEGYDTAICVIGNEEKASVEWKQQYQIAQKMGIRIGTLDDLSAYDVIIDGIFGIGLTRRVEGNYAAAIAQINESGRNVVSVDIPSGVHATTGQILGVAIGSTDTVTFGYAKLGHLFYPGAARTGELTVWNCGFAKEAEDILDRKCFYYEPKDVRRIGSRRPDANKGNYGKVLVIAGCEHMSGAAFFSGKAAYRCGAGLVKILTSKENEPALKKLFPEAVLGFYDGMDKEDLKKEIDWATQVVLGPGLSTGEKAEKIVEWTLQLCEETKLLLDADALNIIAKKG